MPPFPIFFGRDPPHERGPWWTRSLDKKRGGDLVALYNVKKLTLAKKWKSLPTNKNLKKVKLAYFWVVKNRNVLHVLIRKSLYTTEQKFVPDFQCDKWDCSCVAKMLIEWLIDWWLWSGYSLFLSKSITFHNTRHGFIEWMKILWCCMNPLKHGTACL